MTMCVRNSADLSGAPYNTSPTKQLYSFSKASRFRDSKSYTRTLYYNLPSPRGNRATNFGYGQRFKNSNPSYSPGPSAYRLNASFSGDSKGKAFTFGLSRETVHKSYLRQNPPRDPTVPGPGSYAIQNFMGIEGSNYSFRPRTSQTKEIKTPGPGTYHSYQTINPHGRYMLSKYRDAGGTILRMTSNRFHNFKPKSPGPGHYRHLTFSSDGSYIDSKFRTNLGKSIPKSNRVYLNARSIIGTPGPGSYRAPSEFGYYEPKSNESSTSQFKTSRNSPRAIAANQREFPKDPKLNETIQ